MEDHWSACTADHGSTSLTIGQRVSIGGTDLNDRSSWWKILIDHWSVVISELWVIIIDVYQMNDVLVIVKVSMLRSRSQVKVEVEVTISRA